MSPGEKLLPSWTAPCNQRCDGIQARQWRPASGPRNIIVITMITITNITIIMEFRQDNGGFWAETRDFSQQPLTPFVQWLKKLTCVSVSLNRHCLKHQLIKKVECLPDLNAMPDINGLHSSSFPTPPYFSSPEEELYDRDRWTRNTSTISRFLPEGKILQSSNLWLPECPEGPSALESLVLGNRKSATKNNDYVSGKSNGEGSPHLHLNVEGQLVGENMDPISQFCLTWESDPRY